MAPAVERVVVINDDSIESGGAASIALASVRELRRRDVPVTLLTGDEGANPELARLGADVVSLEGQHILEGNRAGAALRGLYSQRTAARLSAWIEAHDTPNTVYHLHNWHKVLSASAFVALRRIAPRLVISTHDYFLACPNGGYFHYPRGEVCERTPLSASCLAASCDKRHYGHKLWRVARGALRQFLFSMRRSPVTVLAVHEGMRPLLERADIAAGSIRVLRNPVAPWLATRVEAEGNATFVFVGRIEEDKGVTLLANAARRVGAPLCMIGKGSSLPSLARDFPEIELPGWKSRPEIVRLCARARALVMPTRSRETFGIVALEAAMSGIPVVASSAALIADDLVRTGVGVAFKANDVEALAQTLLSLMRDDGAVARMSRCGFERARALAPTPEAWGSELLDIYRGKLASAQSARIRGPEAAGHTEDEAATPSHDPLCAPTASQDQLGRIA